MEPSQRVKPELLLPDEGEAASDGPEKTVRILADLHAVAVTASRYAPGVRGPDPHVHHRHTDAFYVLEGALVFEIGRERELVRGEPGTFVAVPAEVVHTFWNDGPEEARFLNVHAPGERFGEYLRAARDGLPNPGFDSDDPPADGGRPAADVALSRAGAGEPRRLGDADAVVKASAADTEGTLSLREIELPAGFAGPAAHVHDGYTDAFFSLEGTPHFRFGDQTSAAPAGTFAFAPPGSVHAVSNPGGRPARVLNLVVPGDFDWDDVRAVEAR